MEDYNIVVEAEKLKVRLGITDEKSLYLLEDAISEACNYCNRKKPVLGMATAIRDLAIVRYNREGAEGELSRSEGGVSQMQEQGIPRYIRSTLNRYRVGSWGRV